MPNRRLGNTELELSTIGFGAWAIGGGDYAFGWGDQDDDESIRAIHGALDLGVNWIDTAPVYGLGRSEEVVGRALKGRRDAAIIATKCSLLWDGERKIYNSLKAHSIRREVEESLGRLGTDYIDLYQIHWPNPENEIEEGWDAIGELIKTGKIRYAGVSNFNAEQMDRAAAIHPVASLQPPYSMLRRDIEKEILPYCRENNIGVVAYSPMQNGLLTGKFSLERLARLPDNDFRRNSPSFQSPQVEVNLTLVDKLGEIASGSGYTVAQLAIAWVLRRQEVTSAITGTRKPHQIEETIIAGEWQLDKWTIQQVDALVDKRDEQIEVLSTE
ncbi:MAG: aldo/keto reductase [Candidatus Marinimicrobia bacterium]|nr:aldo/keto reductase [Candidatus Neomarinimicrobiota bacterium]